MNLNILLAKNKYKKTLLMYKRRLRKNYLELLIYDFYVMIFIDITALLTSKVCIEQAISEIRFLSL